MHGIDVSPWQPANITALVDYDFAIIKATEGTGYVSPSCDQQYQLAKSRGKGLGVYTFLSGYSAEAEADFFVNNVQGYLGEAILVLDYEAGAINCGREWLRAVIRRVKARTNVPPLVYASQSVVTSQQLDQLCAEEDCGLWVANYGANAQQGYSEQPQLNGSVIRQYTSRGRLNGYGGDLDLNYSVLSLEQWKKYALGQRDGGSAPAPAPAPVSPMKKSNDEIANEVIAGAWGNGDDRRERLQTAGYSYTTIQELVNQRVSRKSVDQLSDEVIAGVWGTGDDRKNRLTEQGYNYDEVQKRVNEKLNVAPQGLEITIPSGAWLGNIAAQYGTSVAQLVAWNRPKYPSMTANYIQAGWVIKVR